MAQSPCLVKEIKPLTASEKSGTVSGRKASTVSGLKPPFSFWGPYPRPPFIDVIRYNEDPVDAAEVGLNSGAKRLWTPEPVNNPIVELDGEGSSSRRNTRSDVIGDNHRLYRPVLILVPIVAFCLVGPRRKVMARARLNPRLLQPVPVPLGVAGGLHGPLPFLLIRGLQPRPQMLESIAPSEVLRDRLVSPLWVLILVRPRPWFFGQHPRMMRMVVIPLLRWKERAEGSRKIEKRLPPEVTVLSRTSVVIVLLIPGVHQPQLSPSTPAGLGSRLVPLAVHKLVDDGPLGVQRAVPVAAAPPRRVPAVE